MKKISAEIVADSISKQGHRITTFLLTYPRFIHAELMTHRMFSRNSASSRAIPFEKMLKMVYEDPFVPIAWQKDHKGMQGTEYLTSYDSEVCERIWRKKVKEACDSALLMSVNGVTKQICNRMLEPYMWHTVLVTATEWDNFFELRCPKYEFAALKDQVFKSKKDVMKVTHFANSLSDLDWIKASTSGAEIHIQALAEAMWDAMNESIPKQLQAGEWHIPFGDKIDESKIDCGFDHEFRYSDIIENKLKIATARCARLSYMTFDGEIDYEKDIKLHDQLLENKHASPMEHCAECKNDTNWYANFKGWQSYRNKLGI